MPDLTDDERLILNLCGDPKVGVKWFTYHPNWGWHDPVENERVRMRPMLGPWVASANFISAVCSCHRTHKALSIEMARYEHVTCYADKRRPSERAICFVGQCRACHKIYWAVVHTLDTA